jgi:hypothetical protein
MNFQTHFSDRKRDYTGVELRPHFLLSELNIRGSAVAAFMGACHVKTEHLVDWEDRLVEDRIEARSMIHLIGEFFGATLREGVWAQRLIMAIARDLIDARLQAQESKFRIRREGDDLFLRQSGQSDERKLSVSIVTASPVSVLLHVGINIDPSGAPVPAIGLDELGISAASFTQDLLKAIEIEIQGIDWACVKVRPVV